MEARKCPACGAPVPAGEGTCPQCGLTGLDLGFLSRADYDRWVAEVLQPHRDTLLPRVYAGAGFGLILTARGNLYGIGANRSGQIQIWGEDTLWEPVLIARNVISAAAGDCYSAYVTRDGEVHLLGRGVLWDRFNGFSGAVAVYGDHQDSFWIQTREGEMLCFGYNSSLPGTHTLWRTLAPMTATVHSGHYEMWESGHPVYGYGADRGWTSDYEEIMRDLKYQVEKTDEYRAAVKRFGGKNLEIHLNTQKEIPVSPTKKERIEYWSSGKICFYDSATKVTVIPEIRVVNGELYTPVPCPDCRWMADSPHRLYSRPVSLETWYALEGISGIRKAAGSEETCMCLMEDGTVRWKEKWGKPEKVEWLDTPVYDIASGSLAQLMVLRNGEVLWGWLLNTQSRNLQTLTLPEDI